MFRRYWLLYPAWIVLCAILFLASRHREDPSRRAGRMLSDDAAVRAVAILQQRDPVHFRGYEAVHVAWATRGEGGGSADRWVVLCDRVPHTALRDAVVVELDGKDGRLLVIRKPVAEIREQGQERRSGISDYQRQEIRDQATRSS